LEKQHKSLAQRELEDFDKVFRALAHETRRQILVMLQSRGGQVTGDIVERFPDKWPTISRHLKQLEDAGLITVQRNGRQLIYSVNNTRLKAVVHNWMQWF